MKYTVYKEIFFSAAHRLRSYNGKCENLHGHNWKVRVCVTSEKLDETGFVIDFKILSEIMKDITDILDHQNVNEVPPFDTLNPTAENIATYFLHEAGKKVKEVREDIFVTKVMVWESEKSCATVEK